MYGEICHSGHEHVPGFSLRYIKRGSCVDCKRQSVKKAYKSRKKRATKKVVYLYRLVTLSSGKEIAGDYQRQTVEIPLPRDTYMGHPCSADESHVEVEVQELTGILDGSSIEVYTSARYKSGECIKCSHVYYQRRKKKGTEPKTTHKNTVFSDWLENNPKD